MSKRKYAQLDDMSPWANSEDYRVFLEMGEAPPPHPRSGPAMMLPPVVRMAPVERGVYDGHMGYSAVYWEIRRHLRAGERPKRGGWFLPPPQPFQRKKEAA